MKSIAQLRIADADPRLKSISQEEIERKIDLIYELGYVYDPYEQKFFNPFISKSLKGTVIYDLDLASIQNLNHRLTQQYISKNGSLNTITQIERMFNRTGKNPRLSFFLESMGGVIGIGLLVIALILHVTNNLYFALYSEVASFILLAFYYHHNSILGHVQGNWMLSSLWAKYGNIFSALSFLSYPYLYYLLFAITGSYWLPVVIVLVLRYFIRRYVIQILSRQFWQMTGIFDILERADKAGERS